MARFLNNLRYGGGEHVFISWNGNGGDHRDDGLAVLGAIRGHVVVGSDDVVDSIFAHSLSTRFFFLLVVGGISDWFIADIMD